MVSNMATMTLSPMSISNMHSDSKPNSNRVTPYTRNARPVFKIKTGENTMGDDESWDTSPSNPVSNPSSPSVIKPKKRLMPDKVKKKVVNKISFISSLEQIDDY